MKSQSRARISVLRKAQQLKIAAMPFDERKTFAATMEDLEQNTADLPVVMQRQVLVIHKALWKVDVPVAFSTLTRPSMSKLRSDAENQPSRHQRQQHEGCMTKYNEIEMVKKRRSAQFRTENKKQIAFDSERVRATCVSEFAASRGAALCVVRR